MTINKNFFLQKIFPRHFNTYYELLSSQWKSSDELLELQNEKLRKLANFLMKNNSYYKQLKIGKIDSVHKLKEFPLLTKEKLKINFEHLITNNIESTRFLKNSTGGSTGEVTYFYTDKKLRNDGFGLRTDSWTGWRPGESNVYLWGAERDVKVGWRSKLKNTFILYNKTLLSSYYMTDLDMKHYVSILNKKKPKLIVGYPSSLELLSKFIINTNLNLKFTPKGIVTSGETLYSFQREIIEQAFNTKVLNRYAAREVDVIASECKEQKGLHINAEHLIVEILNEKGEPCVPGELGEIVITDLDNYVFPFIRYKIGDLGSFSNGTCSCGRGLPLLKNVYGRTFDLIIGTNGNRVPGNFFTLLRNRVNGIEKFQIKQKVINQVDLFLETDKSFSKNEENKLVNLLKEKLGDDMKIDITVVERIPLTKAGKHRWVISEVSPFN